VTSSGRNGEIFNYVQSEGVRGSLLGEPDTGKQVVLET
jgi:hypothetical protein